MISVFEIVYKLMKEGINTYFTFTVTKFVVMSAVLPLAL